MDPDFLIGLDYFSMLLRGGVGKGELEQDPITIPIILQPLDWVLGIQNMALSFMETFPNH